jgi:hypothetical protein
MACIVFKACNAGTRDTYAFKMPEGTDIPTDTADVQSNEWDELRMLVEEWAESACALEAGEEFTIGVNSTDDPGWARLASDSLWCAGYYTMPADDDENDDDDDDEG